MTSFASGFGFAFACVIVFACGRERAPETTGLVSPRGWASARVAEYRVDDGGYSQVVISFDGGRCAGGSFSAVGVGLGIRLSWIDEEILQVSVPKAVDLQPPPGSSARNHTVGCFNREVSVIATSH